MPVADASIPARSPRIQIEVEQRRLGVEEGVIEGKRQQDFVLYRIVAERDRVLGDSGGRLQPVNQAVERVEQRGLVGILQEGGDALAQRLGEVEYLAQAAVHERDVLDRGVSDPVTRSNQRATSCIIATNIVGVEVAESVEIVRIEAFERHLWRKARQRDRR